LFGFTSQCGNRFCYFMVKYRKGVRDMLLVVSLILIGVMCSMRIVSLHMIEREKIEERDVYCPKRNAKI
ncbi:hypothetical protein, partial [Bacillus thuringiensis]